MLLKGKIAIVTGAGRGIGRAIALRFAREGASVVVDDIDPETARRTAGEINDGGGTAIAFKADVTKRAEVQRMVKAALERFKAVHILVNNAGISRHAPLTEITDDDWDAVLDVDLRGVFNCTQAVAACMMQQRYGKIISISSVAGTGAGGPGRANYAAAKGGVVQLTKVVARELGPYGVNVNAVAPGSIPTTITSTRRGPAELEEHIRQRKGSAVLGRVGLPEDVANLVLFLASEESSFITGQVICVDAGRTDRI